MDIKQFSGLANKVALEAIPLGALTAATNTDIDNAGKLRRRRGMTQVSAGGFHSLFAVSDTEGYVVKDGDLCRFSASMALETIAYDWTAIFGMLLQRNWQEQDSWFCSELVEAALTAGGRQRFRDDVSRITPHQTWAVM